MIPLILRRLRDILLMVIAISLLTPLMLWAVPGGYCGNLPDHVSENVRQACQEAKEPSWQDITLTTFRRLLQFDLGRSLRSNRPVTIELAEQLPSTFKLSFLSLSLSVIIGLIGGTILAEARYKLRGKLLNWAGIAILPLPSFVIALLLLQVVALRLKWLRILNNPDTWQGMIMPVLAISIPLSALFARLTRNAMIDVLDKDYILVAHTKGLQKWQILIRHALPNALAALIPFTGLVLASLLDGTLLIEIIFTRPGLGKYTFDALLAHDYVALQGVVLLVTVFTASANFLADLAYMYFLPQSRAELLDR